MLRDTGRDQSPQVPSICNESIKDALAMLSRAAEYAEDADSAAWDFAIEIHRLLGVGLNECDLRWLILKGYTEHARETTGRHSSGREFTYEGDLTFSESSCFVLTESGAKLAINFELLSANASVDEAAPVEETPPASARPFWDRERRELMYRGKLVKRFRLPSPNQELVLSTFQDDGWPCRIDDPLPPVFDKDIKRRLRDTINSLNRHQKFHRLRFAGDGTGEGVIWEEANGKS